MAMALASCNNQAPKVEEKSQPQAPSDGRMRIAYVEVDSIMSQYKFCKDFTAVLEKKAQNVQSTLKSRESALASAVTKFQQDVQNNQYTQQQAESVQASLQKQNSDLQALQQRLAADFQAEQEKYNEALHDSLQNYLGLYNKDKKFTLILSKMGDNILYADKTYDITDEVVAGLNKAYKGMPAAKKEEKKK